MLGRDIILEIGIQLVQVTSIGITQLLKNMRGWNKRGIV